MTAVTSDGGHAPGPSGITLPAMAMIAGPPSRVTAMETARLLLYQSGWPRAALKRGWMQLEPVHRTILAIEVAGFASPERTDPDRLHLRRAFWDMVRAALASSGISAAQYHAQDVGDGALILIDPAVPRSRLLDSLVTGLAAQLADYNLGQPKRTRLRLRIAVHAGEVLQDEHGHAGQAVVLPLRLLASQELLTALHLTDTDLAVGVTGAVYRGVIEDGYSGIDPSSWRPVEVSVKESRFTAWIYLPSISGPSLGPPTAPLNAPPLYRENSYYSGIFLVDIQNYGPRPDTVKGRLRAYLDRMVLTAIAAAGITPAQHELPQDEGDGLCVLFQPDVPKSRLLHPLIPSLTRQLVSYNAAVSEPTRMRLRMVVEAGDLRRDARGYYGTTLDEAYGLVNAEELRECLRHTEGPLVLLATAAIYDGVVRHGYVGIDPATYEPLTVRLKHRDLSVWVHHPRP